MSVDAFLSRQYDADRYNCAHLVVDAWRAETGDDLSNALCGLLQPVQDRHAGMALRRQFKRLSGPVSPCIVLMQRRGDTHVGIYLRGRVLHMQETGVEFMPVDVATRGFTKIGFYQPCNA